MAIFRNATFRAALTRELEQRRLGPFESDAAA